MFQALFLMCATIHGDECVVVVSPMYNTEQACLAAFVEDAPQVLVLQPGKLLIEHRCIEWQYSFPNA